jgi:alanine racemase
MHGGRALAVIKADAYGHGALACAKALAHCADGFAVAFLDEACELREGGVRNSILVLEGPFSEQEMRIAHERRIWLVVHQDEQIRMRASSHIPPYSQHVWLKIDTGMRRAGFDCEGAVDAYERLLSTGKVRSITLMTHFTCADQPDRDDCRTDTALRYCDQAPARCPQSLQFGRRSLLAERAQRLGAPGAHALWHPSGRPHDLGSSARDDIQQSSLRDTNFTSR